MCGVNGHCAKRRTSLPNVGTPGTSFRQSNRTTRETYEPRPAMRWPTQGQLDHIRGDRPFDSSGGSVSAESSYEEPASWRNCERTDSRCSRINKRKLSCLHATIFFRPCSVFSSTVALFQDCWLVCRGDCGPLCLPVIFLLFHNCLFYDHWWVMLRQFGSIIFW